MSVHVLVPVADGSEEIEAVGIIDTLVRGGIRVTVASAEARAEVRCSRGVRLVADALLSDIAPESAAFDAIIVPGGARAGRDGQCGRRGAR